MPEPAADALQALRDRLEETRVQAAQLAEEAAAARAGGDAAAGPAGAAGEDGSAGEARAGRGPTASPSDLQALVAVLETLRELVPPELQRQLAEVTRQVLLLVRALIDWWVERLEPPAERPGAASSPTPDPRPVHDIPVT